MFTEWGVKLPWNLIYTNSEKFNLNPLVVGAVIQTESSGNPYAYRFEKNWKYFFKCDTFAIKNGITLSSEKIGQATSWGLMQIMGAVARECGFKGSLPKLCLMPTNLYYGCKKLSILKEKHTDIEKYISAYNAGIPTNRNKEYVDKVLTHLASLNKNC